MMSRFAQINVKSLWSPCMIKGRLIPFLAVFLLVMAGCNRYDFNNRDEYKKLSEQKRYASIEKSIKKNKINNEDKLQVKYKKIHSRSNI